MVPVTLVTYVGGFDDPSGFLEKKADLFMPPVLGGEVEIPSLDLAAPLRIERILYRLDANDFVVYLTQIRAVSVNNMVEKMRTLGWRDVR